MISGLILRLLTQSYNYFFQSTMFILQGQNSHCKNWPEQAAKLHFVEPGPKLVLSDADSEISSQSDA